MKKALCFLLVILMLCPLQILAAEADCLVPAAPPEEAGEGQPQQEAPGEYLSPGALEPEAPAEPSTDLPADFLVPAPEDSAQPAQPDAEPAGEEEDPTVQMNVPSSGQIIINPYGYSVQTNLGTTNEQVISTTQYLVSRSDVPISVSVEISGTHSNPEARFVSTEPDPSAKELFLYAEFQPVAEGEDPVWIGSYTGADCQVLINQTKEKTVTLPSGEDTPRKVAFRLFGAVSSGTGSGWTGSDSLSVTMSYKFDPLVETEPADETDGEAQPEEETPETPEEDPVLDEKAAEETPDMTEEPPEETTSPEETADPIEEIDSSEDRSLESDQTIHPGDTLQSKPDRPSFRDEDEDDGTSERDTKGGLDWLDTSNQAAEPDRSEPDGGETDSVETGDRQDSETTDHGNSMNAWFAPADEIEETGDSEEAGPPQDEDEGEAEEQQQQAPEQAPSDETAWLSP